MMQHTRQFFTVQHSTPHGLWVNVAHYVNGQDAEAACQDYTVRYPGRYWRVIQRPLEEWLSP
jgi:hypothetical protein